MPSSAEISQCCSGLQPELLLSYSPFLSDPKARGAAGAPELRQHEGQPGPGPQLQHGRRVQVLPEGKGRRLEGPLPGGHAQGLGGLGRGEHKGHGHEALVAKHGRKVSAHECRGCRYKIRKLALADFCRLNLLRK